ncbi:MAG: hypothetical protein WBK76_04075 [Candidatus Saccharimonadales bacterium]
MSDVSESHITLKDGKATGVSSRAHGANIDGVGFNLGFIAEKNPVLATTILNNYKEASALSSTDPEHPDEDVDLALDNLKDLSQ